MLTPNSKRRLLAIRAAILEEPARLRMSSWHTPPHRRQREPACHTVGCIAGWAMALERLDRDRTTEPVARDLLEGLTGISEKAANLLDLDCNQADRLFFVSEWPIRFGLEIALHAPQSRGYAFATARRIDHFLRTGGEE